MCQSPLGSLVCITGVSGSGKSTLIEEVLYRGVRRQMGKTTDTPGQFRVIEGLDHIDDMVMVSQAQIGKTTRSNPVSYVGALTSITRDVRPTASGQAQTLYGRILQFQFKIRSLPTMRRQRI